MTNFWSDKRVVVTGACAMIGVELIRQLKSLNPKNLVVVDDYSSGKRENLGRDVYCIEADLRNYKEAKAALRRADVVFCLAAAHGGRAFVDTHKLESYENSGIDASTFRACAELGVDKVVYMSSACAYDTSIQQDVNADLKLSESMIDYDKAIVPDGAYGEQKLFSEKLLNAYANRGHFKGVAVRGFTVYGKYVSLTHFVGAAIARTFVRQDPLVVFGDGTQRRNWTMVNDTARGLILAAEKMNSGVVNIGTEESNTPNSVYEILWQMFNWKPENIEYRPNVLVGTANRIADATKARDVLGWIPQYDIRRGLQETSDWFTKTYTQSEIRDNFERKLFER